MNNQKLFSMLAGKFSRRILISVVFIVLMLAFQFFPNNRMALIAVAVLVILVVVGFAVYKAMGSVGVALKSAKGLSSAEGMKNMMDGDFVKRSSDILGVDLRATMQGAVQPDDIPNGLPAEASIISVQQGNARVKLGVKEIFELLIVVDITAQTGEVWQTTLKKMVPITEIATFQPGVCLAVKYDPSNRNNITFDRATN